MACVVPHVQLELKEIYLDGAVSKFQLQPFQVQDVMSIQSFHPQALTVVKCAHHIQEQWTEIHIVVRIIVDYMISYLLKVDVVDAHQELSQIQDIECA